MRRCAASRLLVLACFASILVVAATRAAAGPYAYVWANQPVADFYFPSQWHASNPSGGVVTITRNDVGDYSVRFGGLDRLGVGGGNVQVTANGSQPFRCKVVEWLGEDVDVRCFDPFGFPVDWQFFLLVTRALEDTTGLAYAWADLPASPSYTANPIYAHNPGGGDVEIGRASPGRYEVTFPGLAETSTNGGNVIVTAQGTGSEHCKVASWSDDAVDVRCFDTDGAVADSRFTVLYTKPAVTTPDLFFVWADDAGAEGPYQPDPAYAYDASGGTVSVLRDDVGVYRVTFPGLDELTVEGDGHLQVTAYGTDADTCRCVGTSGEVMNVSCFDTAGSPADSLFSALFVAPEADALGGGIAVAGALRLMRRRAPRARS